MLSLKTPVVAPAPVILPKPEPEPVIEEAPAVIEDIVVDSDGDGVPDHLDACPGTPVNTVVDPRGCPVQVNLVEELRQELRVFFDYDKSTSVYLKLVLMLLNQCYLTNLASLQTA